MKYVMYELLKQANIISNKRPRNEEVRELAQKGMFRKFFKKKRKTKNNVEHQVLEVEENNLGQAKIVNYNI